MLLSINPGNAQQCLFLFLLSFLLPPSPLLTPCLHLLAAYVPQCVTVHLFGPPLLHDCCHCNQSSFSDVILASALLACITVCTMPPCPLGGECVVQKDGPVHSWHSESWPTYFFTDSFAASTACLILDTAAQFVDTRAVSWHICVFISRESSTRRLMAPLSAVLLRLPSCTQASSSEELNSLVCVVHQYTGLVDFFLASCT